MAQPAQVVLLDQVELQELQEQAVHKDHVDHKDHKGHKALPELLVLEQRVPVD